MRDSIKFFDIPDQIRLLSHLSVAKKPLSDIFKSTMDISTGQNQLRKFGQSGQLAMGDGRSNPKGSA